MKMMIFYFDRGNKESPSCTSWWRLHPWCLILLALKCVFSSSVSNISQTLIELRVYLLNNMRKEAFYQYDRIVWFIGIIVGQAAIRLRNLTTSSPTGFLNSYIGYSLVSLWKNIQITICHFLCNSVRLFYNNIVVPPGKWIVKNVLHSRMLLI